MKLRNLVMTLLLCMVVGVFATACFEGDTGPVGPKGDKGDQGDKGDTGDAGDMGDTDSREFHYPFLVNWGKASGMMSCEDDLLTTTGMFPGSGLTALPATTNTVRFAAATGSADTANGYVEVECSDAVFDPAPNPDFDGDGVGDLTGEAAADSRDAALLFVKTHRGGDATPQTQAGSKAAASGVAGVSITEQKSFSGGIFFADMDTRGGSDEALERSQLYHDCGVGTAPSNLEGEWRAVKIENKSQNTQLDTNGLETPLPNSLVTKTTQKICLRLDSLPGSVKCYVREQTVVNDGNATAVAGSVAAGVMPSDTEKVIIYGDGTNPMVVMPHAASATAATNAGKLNPTAGGANAQFIGDADDFAEAKICNLFEEAAPTPN